MLAAAKLGDGSGVPVHARVFLAIWIWLLIVISAKFPQP
jgi:hypothetical protein